MDYDYLITEGNYVGAIEVLIRTINQKYGVENVPLMTKLTICFLKLNDVESAKQVCLQVNIILLACGDEELIRCKCVGCDEEVENIEQDFLSRNEYNITLKLIESRFKLIKCMWQGQNRILKLLNILRLLTHVGFKMACDKRAAEFRPHLIVVHRIVVELYNVDHVAMIFKCYCLACAYKYYGHCYVFVEEYMKSIEINNHAITTLLSVFSFQEIRQFAVYGFCLQNMGEANEFLNRFYEAVDCYTKAADAYATATDFPNEDLKNTMIRKVYFQLSRVSNTLPQRDNLLPLPLQISLKNYIKLCMAQLQQYLR